MMRTGVTVCSLVICLLAARTLVSHSFAQDISKQTIPAIPKSVVKAAWVNDGRLVLMMKEGRLNLTDVRGESPYLTEDGSKIVFVRTEIAKKVVAADPRFPQYGTTYLNMGIYSWEFESSIVRKISGVGHNPVVSPSGQTVAFEAQRKIRICSTDGREIATLDEGTHPQWLDNSRLYFVTNEARVMRYQIDKRERSSAHPIRARTLPSSPEQFSSELFRMVNSTAGKLAAQYNLVQAHSRSQVAFIQEEVSYEKGVGTHVTSIVGIEEGGKANVVEIMKNSGLGLGSQSRVREFAVESPTGKIAFAVAAPGSRDAVWLVERSRPPYFLGRTTMLGEFETVRQLVFLDDKTLLVVDADERRTRHELDGATVIIGLSQLEPDQLKLMGLDPAITEADAIYRIRLLDGRREKLSSGHAIAVVGDRKR